MNILVAGMHKSGSTALFNIIRFCFEDVYSSWCGYYNEKNEAKTHLLKTHAYSKELRDWADIIFTTKRDMKDSISSAKRFLTTENIPYDFNEYLKLNTKYYNDWKEYSDYEFVYERYIEDPIKIITEISSVLGVSIDAEKVYSMLMELISDKSLIFGDYTNHIITSKNLVGKMIVGGYADYLTKEEIEAIDSYIP